MVKALIVTQNNGTVVKDISQAAHSISGAYAISTAQEKFTSTPTVFLSGGSTNLNLGTSSDFDWDSSSTNQVCWEMWLYPTSWTGSDNILWETRPGSGGSSVGVVIFINSSGKLCFYFNGTVYGASGTSVTLNSWHHIAVCGTGGVVSMYLDGVRQWTASIGYTGVSSAFRIGVRNDGTLGQAGYFDQMRVTKGNVRYSGTSFTPPAGPFASS